MPVEVKTIESLSFFKGFNYHELKEFAYLLNPKGVKKGDVIIRKGTPALTFYIILSGVFEVSYEESPSIRVDKKGDIMGWSTVIAPFHYTGTVEALEDGDLLYISSREFFQLIQNNNQLGEKIMNKINKVAEARRGSFRGSR